MSSDIVVNIASQFTGKKAFTEAEKATQRLTKNVKSLAAAFGITLSARALINFSKTAVAAFAADDKAAKTLSRTLSNLGLAFADPEIKTFIATLEKQYGVLDDQLRPAFQKLITTTGDYKKSQSLLTTALDLSAQSGVDLVSVSSDLAQAYVGNTRGLVKYNLGLTKAQIAAMSFEDILKRIAVISSGQAALAADTYAGKLDKLTVATSNAQEVLGGALLDALIKLGGGDVDKATDKIDKLSTALAQLIRLATGTSAMSLKDILEGVDYKFGFIPTDRPKAARSASPAGTFKNQQAAEKARAAAIKQEKALAALAKSQAASALATAKAKKLGLAVDKANLALGKGGDVFNLDAIQINAALLSQAEQLGKATNSAQLLAIANDVARLNVKKSMYELEQAIASGDIKAIEAATAKLNTDIKILGNLTNQKLKLSEIEDILRNLKPKDLINLDNLNEAIRLLGLLKIPGVTVPGAVGTVSGGGTLGGIGGGGTTLGQISNNTAELGAIISIIGENGKEFIQLIDGLAPVFQTVEDSGAFNALVKSFMGGNITSFGAGGLKANEGSVSNFSRGGAFDKDITITIVDKTSGLIEVVQDAVIQNNRFGNNLNFAGAIA